MIGKSSLLVLTSQLFAVIVHSLAKLLETRGDVNPQQILQIRMFLTLSLNSLYLNSRCPKELPLGCHSVKHLLVFRALAGICGSFGFYYSLQYLSLADATVLNLLAPLVTGFLSSQRHTYLKLGSAIGCISGVGLVVKPKFLIHFFRPGNEDLYLGSSLGFAFAMMGVLGGVCSYSAISTIGSRAHPLAITNCFAVGTLIISSVNFALIPGVDFDFNLGRSQWMLLVLIGLFSALMEYCLTAGLSSGEDGTAIYMLYMQVVLALAVDAFIWHTFPDFGSLAGSLLIITTILIVEICKEKRANTSDIESCSDTVLHGYQNAHNGIELVQSQMDFEY